MSPDGAGPGVTHTSPPCITGFSVMLVVGLLMVIAGIVRMIWVFKAAWRWWKPPLRGECADAGYHDLAPGAARRLPGRRDTHRHQAVPGRADDADVRRRAATRLRVKRGCVGRRSDRVRHPGRARLRAGCRIHVPVAAGLADQALSHVVAERPGAVAEDRREAERITPPRAPVAKSRNLPADRTR